MSRTCELLAERSGMGPERAQLIRIASPMHDIGKIAVSDDILHKPGKLTPADWDEMRKHPLIGSEILSGSESQLLRLGGLIALTHHERWDGSGYPHGLAGEAIPVEGRIVALADVFDALTSERPYKPAFDVDHAVSLMRDERGRHFDPTTSTSSSPSWTRSWGWWVPLGRGSTVVATAVDTAPDSTADLPCPGLTSRFTTPVLWASDRSTVL